MPSVLQIVSYAKKNLHDLVQVDANKNDDVALAEVPDIFVPIRGRNIKPKMLNMCLLSNLIKMKSLYTE